MDVGRSHENPGTEKRVLSWRYVSLTLTSVFLIPQDSRGQPRVAQGDAAHLSGFASWLKSPEFS